MVFVLLTKNERLESKYSSFWQKYNLLFYSLVKKNPIFSNWWPIGWLAITAYTCFSLKNKRSEDKNNSFWQQNHFLFHSQVKKVPFGPIGSLGLYYV